MIIGAGFVIIIAGLRASAEIINLVLVAYIITLLFAPLYRFLIRKRVAWTGKSGQSVKIDSFRLIIGVFKSQRANVIECRMQPPAIVKHFDEIENGRPSCLPCGKALVM
jgi:hypothetical protein